MKIRLALLSAAMAFGSDAMSDQSLFDSAAYDVRTPNERTSAPSRAIWTAPFARAFYFRTPQRIWRRIGAAAGDPARLERLYERWRAEHLAYPAMTLKFLREEYSDVEFDTLARFADRFAREEPDRLVMLHWNARARVPGWRTEAFFPGHWLHYPGTLLAGDASDGDETIHVHDASRFHTDVGLGNVRPNGRRKRVNDVITLVPVDADGNKRWTEAEHAELVAVDARRGTLEVARGRHGTKARAFAAERTWVAPIVVTGPWSVDALWAYNYSPHGPRDAEGRSTVDVLLEEFRRMRRPGGELAHVGGITFDLVHFDAAFRDHGRLPDIDNDGEADAGYVDGTNAYGLGLEEYFRRLRAEAGDAFVMTGDAQLAGSQRSVSLLNGIESEGLGSHKDGYRAWSKTLNVLRYWIENGRPGPRFDYVVPKTGPEDPFPAEDLVSLANGTFTVFLGNTTADAGNGWISLGEKGVSRSSRPPALGPPIGRPGLLALRTGPRSATHADGAAGPFTWEARNGRLEKDGDGVELVPPARSPGAPAPPDASLVLKRLELDGPDLLLTFDALGSRAMSGFGDDVPQIVAVVPHGGGDRAHVSNQTFGYYDSRRKNRSVFFLSGVGPGPLDVEIRFPRAEGAIELSGVVATSLVPVLYRDFGDGSIVVNPSTRPIPLAALERALEEPSNSAPVLGRRLAACRERLPDRYGRSRIAPASSLVIERCADLADGHDRP